MRIKAALKKWRVAGLYKWIRASCKTKVNGCENKITHKGAFVKKCAITIIGDKNHITICEGAHLVDTHIVIYGNRNTVRIGCGANIKSSCFWAEDSDNSIEIGENTTVYANNHFAVCEGTSICVGNDCMFSKDIYIATGDAHSIVTLEGERINHTESIEIGDHVWIGTKVTCLKGTQIKGHSVIGAGSLVNKKFADEHIIIAGVPARIVKERIDWLRERIAFPEES